MDKKIEQIVEQLKNANPSSETMEDILEALGMREKVLDKVLDSEKYIIAKKVWEDIFNNDTLTYNTFDDYYHDVLLSQI